MVNFNIKNGDCMQLLKTIPDGSIDMVLCDPPYGTMKGIEKSKYDWDVALDNTELFKEIKRVLKNNSACILFSQEPYTSNLITNQNKELPFSYRLIWEKNHFGNSLIAKKAPVSYFEDICVFFKSEHREFCDKYDRNLRDYSKNLFNFISKSVKELKKDFGNTNFSHFYFSEANQFNLCTKKTYEKLIELYKIDKFEGFKSYDELLIIVEEIRINKDENKKTFNLYPGKKYKSNILKYSKDKGNFHPTQKPVALLEDLIKTYSNKDATILDFTMGSGSTGVACMNTDRNFIGFEMDKKFYDIANDRIFNAYNLNEKSKLNPGA